MDKTYKEAASQKVEEEVERIKKLWAELKAWAEENDVDLEKCIPMICIE
jgi:hypothetical protein